MQGLFPQNSPQTRMPGRINGTTQNATQSWGSESPEAYESTANLFNAMSDARGSHSNPHALFGAGAAPDVQDGSYYDSVRSNYHNSGTADPARPAALTHHQYVNQHPAQASSPTTYTDGRGARGTQRRAENAYRDRGKEANLAMTAFLKEHGIIEGSQARKVQALVELCRKLIDQNTNLTEMCTRLRYQRAQCPLCSLVG